MISSEEKIEHFASSDNLNLPPPQQQPSENVESSNQNPSIYYPSSSSIPTQPSSNYEIHQSSNNLNNENQQNQQSSNNLIYENQQNQQSSNQRNQPSSNHLNNENQQNQQSSNQRNQPLSNHLNNQNQPNQPSINHSISFDKDDIKYDNIELEKREKPIGTGGFGRVYKRKEKNKENYYAEKIMNKNKKIKFELELETLKKFNGKENIIHIIDYKENESKIFILMEYCECDLKKYLKLFHPLDIKTVQNIMRQIINGYSLLYSNDYKHYDLKLENILVSSKDKNENLIIKISDFGFVEFSKSRMSKDYPKGTRRYMAPELITENNFSEKADIYSMGIIAYELFTNEFPFHIKDKYDYALDEKLNINFDKIRKKITNEYLFDFIKGCLNPNIRERYDFINFKSNPFLCIKDIENNQKKNQLMI